MGVFDYRCALTGLPIRTQRAVGFWVWRSGKDRWTNASLPVRGRYDSYGRLEEIDRDFNTRLLETSWDEAMESGHLVLEHQSLDDWNDARPMWSGRRREGIDRIFGSIERGTTVELGWVKFAGMPLAQMLIDEAVYDTVIRHAPKAAEPTIARLFPNVLGEAIYGDLARAPAAKPRLQELANFAAFFEQHAKWRPGSADKMIGQYGSSDDLAAWLEARQTFVKSPWLVSALKAEVVGRADDPSDDVTRDYYERSEPSASWLGLCAAGKLTACSSVASLRRQIEQQVLAGEAEKLHAAPLYAIAVSGGLVHQELDLSPLCRLERGSERLEWSSELAPAFLSRADGPAQVALNWDEIELKLPKLDEPWAPAGTKRVLPVKGQRPWVSPADRWRTSFDFGPAQ